MLSPNQVALRCGFVGPFFEQSPTIPIMASGSRTQLAVYARVFQRGSPHVMPPETDDGELLPGPAVPTSLVLDREKLANPEAPVGGSHFAAYSHTRIRHEDGKYQNAGRKQGSEYCNRTGYAISWIRPLKIRNCFATAIDGIPDKQDNRNYCKGNHNPNCQLQRVSATGSLA